MSIRRILAAAAAVLLLTASFGAAQSGSEMPMQHDHGASTPTADPDAQTLHEHHGAMAMAPAREGSGTSWLPDETPMYAVHARVGAWSLMAHANLFLQYLRDSGDRGSAQLGSINWIMGMADRAVGVGHLGLRGMISLEPWTIRGCGYPDLLASGEQCAGETIHDRQHPHDLVMELAATYDRPLTRGLRWQVYGGPVGEPALGPTAFPHRLSAMPSPLAPITHHWFDSTHITFGVATAGIYGAHWKAEGSAFNGREPDAQRTNFDFGPLDSWSGRVWLLPTSRWALQASAGKLVEAEAGHDGGPRTDVTRATASATYHRMFSPGGVWASTIGWGTNREPGQAASHALLAEASLTLRERHAWFARAELSQKSGHDLDLPSEELFAVGKLAGGYTRYFPAWNGLTPGVGGGVSLGIVSGPLERFYGRRINPGIALFATIRPAAPGS